MNMLVSRCNSLLSPSLNLSSRIKSSVLSVLLSVLSLLATIVLILFVESLLGYTGLEFAHAAHKDANTKNERHVGKHTENIEEHVETERHNQLLSSKHSLQSVIKNVMPSVVSITSTFKIPQGYNKNSSPETLDELLQFFNNPPKEESSPIKKYKYFAFLGSGFIISPEGYIVTNNHVVNNANNIEVTISKGSGEGSGETSHYKAKIVGLDKKTDLALLKITSPKPLPYIEFSDSDLINVGDRVIAVGNPLSLNGTVTAGIISAKSRNHENLMGDFLQTDAAINSGNSGGPLCDINGKVIGMNSWIYTYSGGNIGISFALTSNTMQPLIKQLKSKGFIERGFIGVQIQKVDYEIAQSLGLKEAKGVIILGVTENSPAAEAKLQIGDLIMSLNGEKVSNPLEFVKKITNAKINSKVKIEAWSQGKIVNYSVKVASRKLFEEKELQEQEKKGEINQKNKKVLKINNTSFQNINQEIRNIYRIVKSCESQEQVIVIDSPSFGEYNLLPGDIVLSIDNHKVNSIEELQKIIEKMKKQKRKTALVMITRFDNRNRFVTFNIE